MKAKWIVLAAGIALGVILTLGIQRWSSRQVVPPSGSPPFFLGVKVENQMFHVAVSDEWYVTPRYLQERLMDSLWRATQPAPLVIDDSHGKHLAVVSKNSDGVVERQFY